MLTQSMPESQNQTLQENSILVIDHDKDILQLYGLLLSKAGYSVDTAENGAEAIQKAKTRIFDLALVDIVLPDMQGTDLLTKINGPNAKMRKIMVTGNATLDNAVLSLNQGAHAYLRKPVKTEDLLRIVKEQLHLKFEEIRMTQNKIVAFIRQNNADFVKVVRESLNSFLGESATETTLFHLGGEEILKDPAVFSEKLRSFFNVGAENILKEILTSLETRPTPHVDN